MSYDIELMSVGEDVYPTLEASAESLNAVQQEFRYRQTSQRQAGLGFKRTDYTTAQIWDFLRDQRTKFGGKRPYIIAFVSAPLKSSELQNIFGSHEAHEGLAVVTLHSHHQYVKETERFCSYYMVRYAMSFVNSHIKAHDDEARRRCYFNKKLYKPEIRESMDSGEVCNECQDKLDNATGGPPASRLSDEERQALAQMRKVVAGTYPRAVVMKGGGVKGLAFAGALIELERYFYFDRHVGASAGAIAAVLLAAGYTPRELVKLLSDKPFRDFMDAPWWKVPVNLLLRRGCYPGDHFQDWIARCLKQKIVREDEIKMRDITGALIYATRRGPGTVTFDSLGERQDTVASFAARCSMSIPVFFVPQMVDGRRTYDGGLRNNFPLARFLETNPKTPFVALYLRAQGNDKNAKWMGGDLLDIWLDGEERQVVDQHRRDVVVIDTSPVGTVDFKLTPLEKEFLVKIGRAAALKFLADRKVDRGPDAAAVQSADAEAEDLRNGVRRLRASRQIRRVFVFLLVVALAVALYTGAKALANT